MAIMEVEKDDSYHAKPLFEGGVVTSFQGKNNFYQVETYYSGSNGNQNPFTRMPEHAGLVDLATHLYLNIYPTRSRDISIDRMRRSLSHPRTILMLARYGDIPVGFGIFPRLLISGEYVIYSSRGFEPDHEGEGLGTHVLDRAIKLQQDESLKIHRSLRWGVLMTQNPFSVVTLRKLQRSSIIDKILPFDERYYKDRVAQSILLGVHRAVYLHSLGINTVTGVSKGELREIGMNEAYRPTREAVEAWEIHQRMVSPPPEGLDMNREGGDVVYVTFKLKRSNGGATVEIPDEGG